MVMCSSFYDLSLLIYRRHILYNYCILLILRIFCYYGYSFRQDSRAVEFLSLAWDAPPRILVASEAKAEGFWVGENGEKCNSPNGNWHPGEASQV